MCNPERLKISIVMPVYNRQQTIRQSTESVLNQTYAHFELVIVDDASTDETRNIIRSIDDPRIRLIELDHTSGASAARNVGIKQARHDWIAFQDSDDYWLPEKLEKQIELLQLRQQTDQFAPVIYTGFYRYRDGSKEYIPGDNVSIKSGSIHKQLLLGNFISTQTVLVSKTALIEAGGFAEDMPRFQDWELWLRLSSKHPFYCVDEPLVEVYYTEGSISSAHSKLLSAYEKILKKHATLFKESGNNYYASLLFSYGHNLCLAGKVKEGRKQLFRSIVTKPVQLKSYLSFVMSLCGKKLYLKVYQYYK